MLQPKIISNSNELMLTAREVAEHLGCAPDYVGRLCRDGKLDCVQSDGVWLVEQESVFAFQWERERAKAERSYVLSQERKQENVEYKKKHSGSFGLRVTLLSVGVILVMGVLIVSGHIASRSGLFEVSGQNAALAQIDSPFFGTGIDRTTSSSNPNSGTFFKGLAEYVGGFFASDLNVQFSIRKPSPDLSMATTTLADTVELPQVTISTSSPQIIINPIVDHTTERVVVENGISPELLSSIVNELAQGEDGAIQYNKGGSLAASSTGFSWDDKLGLLTVSGSVHAKELCLQDVCVSKGQLEQLLSFASSSPSFSTTTTQ